MIDLLWLLSIGLMGGIIAGYLGIGGGAIFVPLLMFLLSNKVSPELLPKITVATSMGAIVLTSAAGSFRHWKAKNVDLSIWTKLAIGAVIGALFGGLIVKSIPGHILKQMIGVVLFIISIRMFIKPKKAPQDDYNGNDWWLVPIGLVMGVIASTVGVGGGMLCVPFLVCILHLNSHKCAGTSSAITLVLSLSGLIGHIYWGSTVSGRPPGTLGFMYVPYSAILGVMGAVGACLGVSLHKRFKPRIFRIAFAVLLLIASAKIIFGG